MPNDTNADTDSTTLHENEVVHDEDDVDDSYSDYYYLTPKAVSALPNYKYNGEDKSLLYKYILSPFASYLVEHCTPLTLAPNTITLTGLLFMILAYSTIFYHCPTFQECAVQPDSDSATDDIPSWIFLLNALSMLTYQTLDNMDGKQSRKTSTSSPLGLLFDHGIDALNSIFGTANWICAMGLTPSSHPYEIAMMVLCPMIPFFVATWEEYHTGVLVLPPFNGPSEGLIMGACLSLGSWWYGRGVWHGTRLFDGYVSPYVPSWVADGVVALMGGDGVGVKNYEIVLACSVIAAVRETLEKIVNVLSSTSSSSKRRGAMIQLVPIVTFTIGVLVVIHHEEVFSRLPRTCLHLFSILFVEIVTSLMLDHVTECEYDPYRWILLPLVVLTAGLCVGGGDRFFGLLVNGGVGVGGGGDGDGDGAREGIELFIWAYTVGSFVYVSMKISIIIHEICSVLGIWCFDIVTPHPKKMRMTKKKNI